eukprot:TRINITY_DN25897_c0_g1_i2.p1 TRINITY_DN25897_c0_g1~~TRINITY_DN25897_c0_g1_i2.p1  ORF type:complete len:834 (+),score=268.75 TRINITY_DN25897_c0_g1_i2:149-2650(+)
MKQSGDSDGCEFVPSEMDSDSDSTTETGGCNATAAEEGACQEGEARWGKDTGCTASTCCDADEIPPQPPPGGQRRQLHLQRGNDAPVCTRAPHQHAPHHEQLIPSYARINSETIDSDTREMLEKCYAQLQQVESLRIPEDISWNAVIKPLEKIESYFSHVWGAIRHILDVRHTYALREAYDTALFLVEKFELTLRQSRKVHAVIDALKTCPGFDSYTSVEIRVIDRYILDAKLSGLYLCTEGRARFNQVSEELSRLSVRFRNNVLDAVQKGERIFTRKSDLEGLPAHVLDLAHHNMVQRYPGTQGSAERGPWCFSLALYPNFITYCKNRALRENMYRLNASVGCSGEHDNKPIINRILALRQEKAGLLGYSSYADVSLESKMAPSVSEVFALIEKLRVASLEKAQEEVAWMQHISNHTLKPWDVPYYLQRLKENALGVSPDVVNYFPVERVLSGLFGVIEDIFKIKIVQVSIDDELSWDVHIRMYELYDLCGPQEQPHDPLSDEGAVPTWSANDQTHGGQKIATLFLDPYSRPGSKHTGSWMSGIVTRHRNDKGDIVLPVAVMVCNATKPQGDKPALLTPEDVLTLFHEAGHCLQHLLTKIDVMSVSGVEGIEWDAVELPSLFMENWFYLKRNLKSIGLHWKTGEVISDEAIESLAKLRTFMSGVAMLRQVGLAAADMSLHQGFTPDPQSHEAVFERYKEVMVPFSVVDPVDDEKTLCSFSHIFAGGYSAGYYSYAWAEVLAADAFSAFEDAAQTSPSDLAQTGLRFRNTILALGGAFPPAEVFRLFRGRDPIIDPLLRTQGLGDYTRDDLLQRMLEKNHGLHRQARKSQPTL